MNREIEVVPLEAVIIDMTVPENRKFLHLLQLKGAIKLEILGMRHSSGRSAYAHAKKIYGFRGSRESVLAQIKAELERILPKEVQ